MAMPFPLPVPIYPPDCPDGMDSDTDKWLALIYAAIYQCGNLGMNCECVQQFKQTLSLENIRGLNSSPSPIVVPSDPTKFIVPLAVTINYFKGTAAFTSTAINLTDGVAFGNAYFKSANFLNTLSDKLETMSGAQYSVVGAPISQTLYLQANADSAVGDGTMDVYVDYIEKTI